MRCGQQKVKRFDYQLLHRYIDIYSFDSLIDFKVSFFFLLILSILLFKGLSLIGFLIFQFKNTPTLLCLSSDKTKGQYGKNTTLTPTKTLPKKQDYFLVIFQIVLFIYKLDSLKKKTLINQILKIKTRFSFLAKKKKPHHTRVARVMRLFFFLKKKMFLFLEYNL